MGGGGRGGEGGGGRDFLTPPAPWLCAGRVGQRRVRELKKRNPRGPRLPTGEPCIPMGSKVPHIWTLAILGILPTLMRSLALASRCR